MPNETSGFFQIKRLAKPLNQMGPQETTEFINHLNFILRQMQDKLDALGGNRGQWLHEDATNMNEHKVINVVDPTAAQDAATKNYVDDQFAIRGL